ncbi:hypothetical protein EMIT0P395_230058 [Pseudomonas sp. IT-P395]
MSYKWGRPINFLWKAGFLCFFTRMLNDFWVLWLLRSEGFLRLCGSVRLGSIKSFRLI